MLVEPNQTTPDADAVGIASAEFAAYAAAQVARGHRQVAEHPPEGTRYCLVCGRRLRCPSVQEGAELVRHFGRWAPNPMKMQPGSDSPPRTGHE